MKRLLIFAAVVSMLAAVGGCRKQQPPYVPERPSGPVGHTLIMYLAGNNNLSSYLQGNVNEVLGTLDESVPGADGRIVAFYRPSSGSGVPVLLELYYDSRLGTVCDTLKRYDATLSATDVSTLSMVVADAKAAAPAAEYSMVFGSHATGWFTRACMSQGSLTSPMSTVGGSGYGSFWRRYGDEVTRTFGSDNMVKSTTGLPDPGMDITDLAEALSGTHFRALIFDCCFMASAEVAYDLRNAADYLVVSSAEIMGRGFPYELTLKYLFASGSVKDNLKKVCSEYIRFYTELTSGQKSGTISLIDCSRIESLAEAVAAMERAGRNEVDRDDVQAFELLQTHQFFDLDHYYDLAATDRTSYEAFSQALSECVLYAGHTPEVYSVYGGRRFTVARSCGLTVNIPSGEYPLFGSEWRSTAWAQRIGRGGTAE